MRTHARRMIAIAALAFQFSWCFAASPQQELAIEYDSFFRQQVAEEKVLGAAFVLVSGDQIIHIGTIGYTDTGKSRPIDVDTTFRVASVSKTFAAGLTGVLVSEGSFDWDDPVTQYVRDFHIKGDASQVMIRHLLGQSTGLVPHAYDNLIEDGNSIEYIQKQFGNLSYICSPGNCYSYQNSVFSLIEPVIENATTQSYSALMEQKIFQPLDMKTASVGYEAFVNNPNHAKPHVLARSGNWRTVEVLPNYYRVSPAAGVNASVLDMGKWLMAQLGSHPEVIAPDVIALLTRPRISTKRELKRRRWNKMVTDAHYGLGWRVYQIGEHRLAYHSGWVSGYRADVAWSREHDLGFAILLNSETRIINELTTTFWEMVFASIEPLGANDTQDMAGLLTSPIPVIQSAD